MTSIELTIKIDRLWYKHNLIMELIGGYVGEMPKQVEKHFRDKAAEITKDREKLEKRIIKNLLSSHDNNLLKNKDKIIQLLELIKKSCSGKWIMPKEAEVEKMAEKANKLINLLK